MKDQTILIADDDIDLLKILEKVLIEKKFTVYTVDNGKDAISKYNTYKPKVILLDIDMPGKNGWQVLKEIRQENKRIPIIIMTGKHIEEEDALKSFNDGATSFVRKNISYKEIIASVESLFRFKYFPEEILYFGNFTLNMSSLSLYSETDEYFLTDREAYLLSLLVKNINQIIATEEIIKTVWGNDISSNYQMMRNIISKLNKFLEKNSKMRIKSIYGKGYILLISNFYF